MLHRSLIQLGVLSAALMVSGGAFAASDGFRQLNNAAGSEYVGTKGVLTRAQVQADLQAAQQGGSWRQTEASPGPTPMASRAGFWPSAAAVREMSLLDQTTVTARDGWRDVGGEAGWVFQP